MRQPTSQQVQTIIDNFEKVLPLATREDHLDMNEEKVRSLYHDCGTVHCHSGWYAVARLDYFDKYEYNLINYIDGISLMCKDLGFASRYKLAEWLGTKIGVGVWGNEESLSIFYKKNAFYHPEKRPEGAQNLQDIIDHWKEVKERLVQLESKTATDA